MKKLVLSLATISMMFGVNQAQNLINDGGFDTDGELVARTADEWGMWSGNGGTAEVIEGVVNVTPVEAADNWNMQVEQWNAAIENGKTYVVTFDAWADVDRVIALTIEDPANEYRLLGSTEDENGTDQNGFIRSKWNIDITSEQTNYTLTLTVDSVVDNTTVKFAFLLAQTSDMVYLDNVSLVEEGSGVSVASKKASSFTIYPSPAIDAVYVNGKSGNVVNVYNIAGKLVMSKAKTNEIEKLDVSSLASGMYIIKLGDAAQRLIIK
jgi:hypothetical protein